MAVVEPWPGIAGWPDTLSAWPVPGPALWFKRCLQGGKTAPIRVDASLRKSMGLTHDQARRGVHALEAAGPGGRS
jgi:hypothetical protein